MNKIQTIKKNYGQSLMPHHTYVFNFNLHTHLNIKTVYAETITFYKRFYYRLPSNSNKFISNLATRKIPRKPPRCLKRNWCRDLLNEKKTSRKCIQWMVSLIAYFML